MPFNQNERYIQYAKAIKKIRTDNAKTQLEFATSLGKNQNTISSWEVGRTKPSEADILKINSIYKTNLTPQYDYIAFTEIDGKIKAYNKECENIESDARKADIAILDLMSRLNTEGVKEALKRVSELTEISKYRR